MGKKKLFDGIATLMGCMIGAGILGIPYVVAQAGFLTGLINILVLGGIFTMVHLYLGEVTLRTRGNHQLTGYAEKYTGKLGKYLMFTSLIIGIYGALIAYLMGVGEALASIIGLSPLLCSTAFFCLLSLIVYKGLGAIEESESFVVPIVLLIVLTIFVFSMTKIKIPNITGFSFTKLLVPYGVVLFAFIGTSAIPEVKEELNKQRKDMKRAIIIGSLTVTLVYALFALAIVGVLGEKTQEIGSLGLAVILGEKMAFLGAVFAVLTMTTSFLALGLALKELFMYDYKLRHNTSWLLACFIPFLIFLLFQLPGLRGNATFTRVLEMTGVITGALTGILIILMVINAKKKTERKPEYSIYINKPIAFLLILVFIIGALNLLMRLVGARL